MKPRSLILFALLVAGLTGSATTAAAVSPSLQSAWVELGSGRTVNVRAITQASSCPKVTADGVTTPMQPRAAPASPGYPVLSCEQSVAFGTQQLSVAGLKLPTPVRNPRRIVAVGDTGCRMEKHDFQACNDPQAWPFPTVAASIAKWKPQLIIHVGDYLYRQDPCPVGNTGCAGAPSGYNWPAWDADFFTPAAPALKAAPWIVSRGNHDSCSAAGEGWFRFLDPGPMPSSCLNTTPPYAVQARSTLRMVMIDSSYAEDTPPLNTELFASQFGALPGLIRPASCTKGSQAPRCNSRAWLLGHKPLWGLAPKHHGTAFDVIDQTLEAAAGNALPAAVRLVLSGHVHMSQVLQFAGNRPPQIVAGIGGTELDDGISVPVVGADAAGQPITAANLGSKFGFFTFLRKPKNSARKGWTVRIRDANGNVMVSCDLSGFSAPCG